MGIVRSCLVATLLALAPFCAPMAAQTGEASWYRAHVGITAAGLRQEPEALTAAHPRLPFGTTVRVTNLANDRSVVLTITDRGPFTGGRILDVSEAAARRLGFLRKGVTRVRIEPLR